MDERRAKGAALGKRENQRGEIEQAKQ